MNKKVYIGLGSNLGNKSKNIQNALDFIANIEGVSVKKLSSLYLTAPWGKTDQDDFINQVIEIETDLSALSLLYRLQDIEIKLGRQRDVKWGPRIIDLDVLLYGEETIHLEELEVPHPYLLERLFVLIPLAEIDSELEFPDGTKIREVLSRARARLEGNDIIKL
ncbi:MAG: 2-amino-4-hydroxy-6-hydroxymethyldihydropteridine diphosphokinase [Firmicutes bacterium HGW-Firmicutes-15]|nr:MAG: 2-amino-4-hydroxy-6-hydroxymethyldihydropteridine diphosphokinase [Firmicutes bacterium HGW-Firmicutes-15]